MHIEITDNLPAVKLYQYPFSKKEQVFITAEIKALLAKSVIVETKQEQMEFISPIFVREKSDGGFRLILNLKRLNEVIEYKKTQNGNHFYNVAFSKTRHVHGKIKYQGCLLQYVRTIKAF